MSSLAEDADEGANSRSPQVSSHVIVNDDSHVQTKRLYSKLMNLTNLFMNIKTPTLLFCSGQWISQNFRTTTYIPPLSDSLGFADPRGRAPPYFEIVGDPSDIVLACEGPCTTCATWSDGWRGLVTSPNEVLSDPHVLGRMNWGGK